MTKNTVEEVHQAIKQVMHPEIDYSLVELGMIKDVVAKGSTVTVILALPFKGIPTQVRGYMVNSIRQTIIRMGGSLKVEVNFAEMSEPERAAFLTMAREKWKGFV